SNTVVTSILVLFFAIGSYPPYMKIARQRTVGNEVRQRASKDLANNLNLALITIYTFLLFFCCFGCQRGKKPGNKGFSPATGSATG
ncbi:hypothetical protein, partial [Waltera sp.]